MVAQYTVRVVASVAGAWDRESSLLSLLEGKGLTQLTILSQSYGELKVMKKGGTKTQAPTSLGPSIWIGKKEKGGGETITKSIRCLYTKNPTME